MRTKSKTKLVHEGDFVAEVPVELIETKDGWSPYLSVEDARKLDEVREALRRRDLNPPPCLDGCSGSRRSTNPQKCVAHFSPAARLNLSLRLMFFGS
jgi:hypothetical protein